MKVDKVIPPVEQSLVHTHLTSFQVEAIWLLHLGVLDVKSMSLLKEFQEHGAVMNLQIYLRHHFLLASINKFGQLHYQDVTIGEMVANYRTGLVRTDVMQVNPYKDGFGC